jgi:hypothetical protein
VPLTDAIPRLQLSACWRRDGANSAVAAFVALLPAAKATGKVSSIR